jgi:hypothetical protein
MLKLVPKCYTLRRNAQKARFGLDLTPQTFITIGRPRRKSTGKKMPGFREEAELSLREGAGVSSGIHKLI